MKRAILLLNMGGPGSLEQVRAFLFHLFKDPAILRIPALVRIPLAALIAWRREKKAQAVYARLGGASPLLKNTQAQAAALETLLGDEKRNRCFVGMSYAPPFIRDAMQEIKAFDPDEVVLLPLYPQYSTATTQSVLRDCRRAIEKTGLRARVKTVGSFPDAPGWIKAQAALIQPLWEQAGAHGPPLLLMSAHGLPESMVRAGDPYPQECQKTAHALRAALGLNESEAILCYQSRVGPMKWIGPATEELVAGSAKEKRPIVVAPIAFVSDHAETLVELSMEYKELAEKSGCPFFGVAPAVGTHPAFIAELEQLLTKTQ